MRRRIVAAMAIGTLAGIAFASPAQARSTLTKSSAVFNTEMIVSDRLGYSANEARDIVRTIKCKRRGEYRFRCDWSAGSDTHGYFGKGHVRRMRSGAVAYRF